MTRSPSDLLTLLEVKAEFGLGADTLRRWIRKGFIAATKLGSQWHVRRGNVQACIDERAIRWTSVRADPRRPR